MELKKAIEIIRAMCKESKQCKDCPLFIIGGTRLCDVGNLCPIETSMIEPKLIQWEKDHKKHYPTWKQWARGKYPLGNDSIICPKKFYASAVSTEKCESMTCVECYGSEISERAAKTLGVQPIEREDD